MSFGISNRASALKERLLTLTRQNLPQEENHQLPYSGAAYHIATWEDMLNHQVRFVRPDREGHMETYTGIIKDYRLNAYGSYLMVQAARFLNPVWINADEDLIGFVSMSERHVIGKG